jgi:hypothetical protein
VGFSATGIAVEFRFLRGKRSPAEQQRWLDLLREVPGARRCLEGVEERDFRVIGSMKPDEVLMSDEALERFKWAISEAVKPPDVR